MITARELADQFCTVVVLLCVAACLLLGTAYVAALVYDRWLLVTMPLCPLAAPAPRVML